MYEKESVQSMLQEMGRVGDGERRRLFVSKVQGAAFKIITSAVATAIIGIELIKYTLDKRGYFAVGGEWIMMIMVFIATYTFLGKKKAEHKK